MLFGRDVVLLIDKLIEKQRDTKIMRRQEVGNLLSFFA